MRNTKNNIIIVGILFLFALISCEKEYDSIGLLTEEKITFQRIPFILPINFEEFNISLITKSPQESGYSFNYNPAMLDTARSFQKEVKPGIIYTETPLKGTLFCKTSSEYLGEKLENESFIPAKMFHIKKEFCLKDSLSERIVTMIPTSEYYKTDSAFSYLNMPNFSGTVITSSLEGEPIDVWGVRNGCIGFGHFLKNNQDPIFARVEFSSSPNPSEYENTLTKSDSMDDTLDVCHVVANYTIRNNINPLILSQIIKDPIGNRPPGPDWQYPGSGFTPDEEEEGSTYYTATINTKFCNSENTSNTLYCSVNTDLKLDAKSSTSDSCIFFCWKKDGKVHTHEPSFVIMMDKSYTFNVIYHSNDNQACYELAKTYSEAAFIYKMDSLRMVMNNTQKETGLAKRSDGTYYRLTNGTEHSIKIIFENDIKYDYIYHTHPGGFCVPSTKDMLTLLLMVNHAKPRINDYGIFRFGIITENDILSLKVKDTAKVKGFLNYLIVEYGNAKAEKMLKRKYIAPITRFMVAYNANKCLQRSVPFYENIGLEVYYSLKEQSGEVKWKYVSVGNDNTIDYSECYNK